MGDLLMSQASGHLLLEYHCRHGLELWLRRRKNVGLRLCVEGTRDGVGAEPGKAGGQALVLGHCNIL